jgi:hypothetical protein
MRRPGAHARHPGTRMGRSRTRTALNRTHAALNRAVAASSARLRRSGARIQGAFVSRRRATVRSQRVAARLVPGRLPIPKSIDGTEPAAAMDAASRDERDDCPAQAAPLATCPAQRSKIRSA